MWRLLTWDLQQSNCCKIISLIKIRDSQSLFFLSKLGRKWLKNVQNPRPVLSKKVGRKVGRGQKKWAKLVRFVRTRPVWSVCGQKKWAFAQFWKKKWAENFGKKWLKMAKKGSKMAKNGGFLGFFGWFWGCFTVRGQKPTFIYNLI